MSHPYYIDEPTKREIVQLQKPLNMLKIRLRRYQTTNPTEEQIAFTIEEINAITLIILQFSTKHQQEILYIDLYSLELLQRYTDQINTFFNEIELIRNKSVCTTSIA